MKSEDYTTLLLASKSFQRRSALEQARIPFRIISQDADESVCDYQLSFHQLLESIALHKMNHVVMPADLAHTAQFVLTVDTMVQDGSGKVYGKPESKEIARRYIQTLRDNPGLVGTAFCLDKKEFVDNVWHTVDRITRFVSAAYTLDISDHWIDIYFEQFPDYLSIAGALTIEEYGAQFLKSINGSYGCAVGLPLYELCESLESLGFFKYSIK